MGREKNGDGKKEDEWGRGKSEDDEGDEEGFEKTGDMDDGWAWRTWGWKKGGLGLLVRRYV